MYRALLTIEELKKFNSEFFELELGKITRVITEPDGKGKFRIKLEPTTKDNAKFLRASFTDGLMAKYGWNEKFKKI